jgi:hypothetical protein
MLLVESHCNTGVNGHEVELIRSSVGVDVKGAIGGLGGIIRVIARSRREKVWGATTQSPQGCSKGQG